MAYHEKVLIFRRVEPPGSPQIRFHLTRTSPLHSILTECAFSTAHTNIITWNKAYCMFPNVTFMDRRMYLLHNPDKAMGDILSKYSAHGWRTSDWVDYNQVKGRDKAGIREKLRRIGDSSTWVIPLNTHKIRTPRCPDSVLESCTFQVFPDSRPQTSHHTVTGLKTFGIGAQTFSCCMLKYIYTFHALDTNWVVFLRERLNRMIMLELLKTGDIALITAIVQPDFVFGNHKRCPLQVSFPHFKRPDGWECVDHMLPAWLEEWKLATRDKKESAGLTPHPLTIARPNTQSGTSLIKFVEPAPPLIPTSGARCATASKLPSKSRPAPLLIPESDELPRSLRTTSKFSARPLRSISVNQLSPSDTAPKLPTPMPLTRGMVSAQSQHSGLESSLARVPFASSSFSYPHPASSLTPSDLQSHPPQLARFPTSFQPSVTSPNINSPRSPEKRKAHYFSSVQKRSKASIPPPLNLPTADSSPLVPDLLTPPLDVPSLGAGQDYKRSPIYFPSHLPWSPIEEKSRSMHRKPGFKSPASAGFEKMVPGEMNWI
jgi:hypothetical protein